MVCADRSFDYAQDDGSRFLIGITRSAGTLFSKEGFGLIDAAAKCVLTTDH